MSIRSDIKEIRELLEILLESELKKRNYYKNAPSKDNIVEFDPKIESKINELINDGLNSEEIKRELEVEFPEEDIKELMEIVYEILF